MEIQKIEKIITELQQAFDAIAMSRSPYVLENLVVKEKDTEPEQWTQCVLEMRVKYINIKRLLLEIEKLKLNREIYSDTRLGEIENQLNEIEIEDLEWQLNGQLREFFALHSIYQSFDKQYTREELNEAQREYWFKRLSRQATQDILAKGRISVGNQDALRQINVMAEIEGNSLNFHRLTDNTNDKS
jgi:hypothetical protein